MTHDQMCASLRLPNLFSACSAPCDCARFAEVRADERQRAEYRVSVAPEHVVRVKGLSRAVILRSDAIQAAGGAP